MDILQADIQQKSNQSQISEEELTIRYLKYIVEQGAHNRYGDIIPPDVQERIEMEYSVIIPNKFVDYILMLWDIHEFCRTPDRVFEFCKRKNITAPPDGIIPIGPGRGSVGGSMVCYCIGITQCDPLLFGLFFERFLNPERIAPPDIDFDISQRYRHIGVAYVADKYGQEYVSQIITFGTFSKKNVTTATLSALGVPNTYVAEVKKQIPEDPGADLPDILEDEKFITAMKNLPFLDMPVTVTKDNAQKILNSGRVTDNEVRSKILNVALGVKQSEDIVIENTATWEYALNIMLRLEKLNKNASVHAAGLVVASKVLETNVPLMVGNDGGIVCQYEKQEVESLGYIKLDMLGLRNVDVNYDAEQMVRKMYNPNFNMYKLPYNDKETIQLINNCDNNGIFQIEGTGFTNMMKDLDIGGYELERFQDRDINKMSTIEKLRGDEIYDFMWISAGLALYRPGPLDAIIEGKTMVQHLIDRKAGKEPVAYLFQEEKIYLEETYGVLVYQEQVMSRVRAMTGCSYGRADILRKAMGKKDPVLMKEQMDWFKKAAMEYNFSSDPLFESGNHKEQVVNRAAYEIETFSRYGFNKAHAVEYAHICYHNAYFKTHYSDCFYCALINSLPDKPQKQTIMIRDMINHDVELLSPDINASQFDFAIVAPNQIRFGLGSIRQFGKAAGLVLEDRDKNGEFGCVEQFRIRIPAKSANKIVITNLAKCGAFDSILQNNVSNIQFSNRATLVATMENMCKSLNKLHAKKGSHIPTVEEALKKWENGAGAFEVVEAEEDLIEYSKWEKEMVKYYISAHPIDAYRSEMLRWGTMQSEDIADMPDEVYIAGFVEDMHETVIKKEGRNKGKKMGFISIGTEFRIYEGTMFPGIYESCLPYIKSGNPVIMKAKKNFYKDNWSLQVEYLRQMSNTGIRDCPECHIRLDNPNDVVGMMRLKELFNQHFGNTKVFIHVLDGYNDITIQLAQTIALNDHIINFIEQIGKLAYKPHGVAL